MTQEDQGATPAEALLKRDTQRRVYLMNDLPPEVVAVTFAKTSRSPESFDQIAAELSETSSAKFHEKWVVGYGHASVAEHAVLSLALENVSILAAKAIEDNRLASYTEKSTRYQLYDPQRVYRPVRIMADPVAAKAYEELIGTLLGTYLRCFDQTLEWLKSQNPKPEGKSERFWVSGLRAQACDAIRYMLPTATLTNLGWTINARSLAHAIRKLGGSNLREYVDIAADLKSAAHDLVPTLLKYCDPDTTRTETARSLSVHLESDSPTPSRTFKNLPPQVRILRHDPDPLRQLTCAVAYASQPSDWEQLEGRVAQWSAEDMLNLLGRALADLGPHDPLPRAFEHLNYLVEITIDYGAWRDIQRHRIGTQTAQDLSPDLGYTVPVLIDELGLRPTFEQLLAASASTHDMLKQDHPDEAVYALMLAFHKRSLFAWNLREVFHFVRLRGSSKGHAAYRRVAVDLWRSLLRIQPWLGEILFPLGPEFQALVTR